MNSIEKQIQTDLDVIKNALESVCDNGNLIWADTYGRNFNRIKERVLKLQAIENADLNNGKEIINNKSNLAKYKPLELIINIDDDKDKLIEQCNKGEIKDTADQAIENVFILADITLLIGTESTNKILKDIKNHIKGGK